MRACWLPRCAALLLCLLASCEGGQKAEGRGGAAAQGGSSIRYAKELAARADPLMIVASALGDWGSSPSAGRAGAGGGDQKSGGVQEAAEAGETRAAAEKKDREAREAREREAKARREREEQDKKVRAGERERERQKREKEDRDRRHREEQERGRQRQERAARDQARLAPKSSDAKQPPPAKPEGAAAGGSGPGASVEGALAWLQEALSALPAALHAAASPLAARASAWLAAARTALPSDGAAHAAASALHTLCARSPTLARACAACALVTATDAVLLALVAFLGLASWALLAAAAPQARLIYARTPRNERILAGCTLLQRGFRPAPLLASGHAQTGSVLLRDGPRVVFDREMVSTRDGGFVALDWLARTSAGGGARAPPGPAREHQGILVILHGLTGGSHEAYVRGLADCAAARAGLRVVVCNYRGCAGASLFTPQAYSAAWTNDVRAALAHIRARWPAAPLFGVGFSLGANILMKYLGEEGAATPLTAACVVSNPYELAGSNRMMHRGLGPFYDRVLAAGLVRTFAAHRGVLERRKDLPAWGRVAKSTTVLEFDDRHTRRCFGYESVEHYYEEGSCARVAGGVAVPTLFLVAEDDYLLDVRGMDFAGMAANPNILAAVTRRGGHVAWHESLDGRGQQWAEAAAVQFLVSALTEHRGLP